MTFQGHESVQQHWLCTNTIICMWCPEGGGQVSGVMVLVQESISYTPSLNQHSTPRSLHLETVMRCCTTATLAPSIRAQHKAEATSRRGRDTNTNSGSVWDSLHSTKLEKGGSFFSGDTNPRDKTPHLFTSSWWMRSVYFRQLCNTVCRVRRFSKSRFKQFCFI